MNTQRAFYLCPVCFHASDSADMCHGHTMVFVDPGEPGDERRKPVTDAGGRMVSRAPRWFLEAVGAIPTAAARSTQVVPAV